MMSSEGDSDSSMDYKEEYKKRMLLSILFNLSGRGIRGTSKVL